MQFSEILLIGGTSRIPKIKYILEKLLEKNFSKKTNFRQFYNTEIVPEEAVVTGAAIRAAKFNQMSKFSIFNIEDRSTMEIDCCLNRHYYPQIIKRFKAIPYKMRYRAVNKETLTVKIFEVTYNV